MSLVVVPALSVGQLIGNYRVLDRLAEGGMGEVYEVVHTTLGRHAALKVIHPSLAQDATVVARFLREAQATNQVHHPGVVQIFEYGQLSERHGAPYFVMELLEGETLSTCIRRAAIRHRGPLGLSCIRLLQQVAKTLAVVHSQGLVHRDVKPANIMIISDPDVMEGKRIKLLDFGIVKILSSAGSANEKRGAGLTANRTVLGTPEFMAPEQWTARDRVDSKADVYALGVITFLCFSGRMPFVAANYLALGLLHCQTRPPALSHLDPSVSLELSNLVAGMLEKHPANRPTMAMVDETMGRLLSLVPTPLTLPGPPERDALDRSDRWEPDAEGSAAVSKLQTYTWEELEIGLVGPSYEDLVPGEPAVQVRVLLSLPPLQVAPGVTPPLLVEPPLLPASANETTERTPSPSLFLFLQHSLMMGSHLTRPLYLVTLGVVVCVLLLLQHRPQRSGGRTASAVSEPLIRLPSLGSSSLSGSVSVSPVLGSASSPARPITTRRNHKHHLRQRCQRSYPTASCIRNHAFTLDQRRALLRAFYLSNTKLCAYEHLVVSTSPSWPSLKMVPPALSGSKRASLQVALRIMFQDQLIPSSIDVRCPRSGPHPAKGTTTTTTVDL